MPRTQIFAALLEGRNPSHAANWILGDFPLLVGGPIRRSGMDTLLFSCKSILNLVKNAVDGCRMT